jgi:hypothetical protein
MDFDDARFGRFCMAGAVRSAVSMVGGLLPVGAFMGIWVLKSQSAGASSLFVKHPHLNQFLWWARLCEKKYALKRSGRGRFFFSKPAGLGLSQQRNC